jgi:hypothetical protein
MSHHRPFPDRSGRRGRDDAKVCEGVSSVGLNLEPDAKARLRVPDGGHFRAGIAGNHVGELSSRKKAVEAQATTALFSVSHA